MNKLTLPASAPTVRRPNCLPSLLIILALTFLFDSNTSAKLYAQEAINMPAATQPSRGVSVWRSQFRFLDAERDPTSGDRSFHAYTLWNNIAYGLTGNVSINLTLPVEYRDYLPAGSSQRTGKFGLRDMEMQAKWRIYQNDFGPIDSGRLSLLAGAQIPSGTSGFTTGSFNPIVGTVYTHIEGRHGFNIAGRYKFNTGRGTTFNLGGGNGAADAFLYDASWLYRISPATYHADTTGAWYAVMEVNGVYETNGDNEPKIAPGLMYEARTWTVELSFQVPVLRDVSHRPKTRYAAVIGYRQFF